MKILFFTDTHIRGNNPANRKDIYIDSIERKIEEIVHLTKKLEIDYLLHGGDLFDRPDVSISVVNRLIRVLNRLTIPLYMVSGNHDIYGHNPKTVGRTILSLLDTIDLVKLINPNEKVMLAKDGINVQLTGQPYVYDIDRNKDKNYYILQDIDPKASYSIHMVHGLLLDKPFIKGIDYTLVEDIKSTKADITLVGHYHSGFKTQKIDNKYFVSPGSIARISNSKVEIKRRPKAILINIDNEGLDIEDIYLETAKPGIEVLDRDKIDELEYKNEKIHEFKQEIDSAINFKKLDIFDILIQVSKADGIDKEVRDEAIKRVGEIQSRKSSVIK